jgi:hypothetical protein
VKKLTYKQMQEAWAERDRDFSLARLALTYFAQSDTRTPDLTEVHEGETYRVYIFHPEAGHGGIIVITQQTPQPNKQPAFTSVTPHYADDLRQEAKEASSSFWRYLLERALEINDERQRTA